MAERVELETELKQLYRDYDAGRIGLDGYRRRRADLLDSLAWPDEASDGGRAMSHAGDGLRDATLDPPAQGPSSVWSISGRTLAVAVFAAIIIAAALLMLFE